MQTRAKLTRKVQIRTKYKDMFFEHKTQSKMLKIQNPKLGIITITVKKHKVTRKRPMYGQIWKVKSAKGAKLIH